MPTDATEMLAHMANIYRYEISDFEAVLWQTQVINRYPNEAVMRALLAHMESGTNDSNFMPKYGAIKARLEPIAGFTQVHEAVRKFGPYQVPEISDPVLLSAIDQMGGWAKVCEEMPDPVGRAVDFDRYMKRFENAIQTGKQRVNVLCQLPPPLKAIGMSSNSATQPGQLAAPVRALPRPSQA